MADITIVGGGFSASVAKMLMSHRCRIISPQSDHYSGGIRRPALEVNKFFSSKSKSFGFLNFKLNGVTLHDRLSLGGNSNIWGGFVNVSRLPENVLQRLGSEGLNVQRLSFSDTGSISSHPSLAQILAADGNIYDASLHLAEAEDGYLESFFMEGGRIRLNVNFAGKKESFLTDKLVLCVGTVQLLDLMHRSGLLEDGSAIKLSEFNYSLKPKITTNPNRLLGTGTIIRFHLGRALCHLMGIQKNLKLFSFTRWIPLYLEQHFLVKRSECLLELNDGVISGGGGSKFGSSIHYCNMRINGEGVNDIFARISPSLIGLGMSFVNQAEPGPISNDILNDAASKLMRL